MTTMPGAPVAVFAADCALVGLASPEGVVGAVHVGWRSLLAGVLEASVATMRARSATRIVGRARGLHRAGVLRVRRDRPRPARGALRPLGPRRRRSQGRPALDLRAGVLRALEALERRRSRPTRRAAPPASRACSPGAPGTTRGATALSSRGGHERRAVAPGRDGALVENVTGPAGGGAGADRRAPAAIWSGSGSWRSRRGSGATRSRRPSPPA